MKRAILLAGLMLIAATPAIAYRHASDTRNHERSHDASNYPFSDWFCVFGARRVCHSGAVRPKWTRQSSTLSGGRLWIYGADLNNYQLPVQQHTRRHLPAATVLAKRKLDHDTPRPAGSLAGADNLTVRQCWDTVQAFEKWEREQRK